MVLHRETYNITTRSAYSFSTVRPARSCSCWPDSGLQISFSCRCIRSNFWKQLSRRAARHVYITVVGYSPGCVILCPPCMLSWQRGTTQKTLPDAPSRKIFVCSPTVQFYLQGTYSTYYVLSIVFPAVFQNVSTDVRENWQFCRIHKCNTDAFCLPAHQKRKIDASLFAFIPVPTQRTTIQFFSVHSTCHYCTTTTTTVQYYYLPDHRHRHSLTPFLTMFIHLFGKKNDNPQTHSRRGSSNGRSSMAGWMLLPIALLWRQQTSIFHATVSFLSISVALSGVASLISQQSLVLFQNWRTNELFSA